MKVLIVDIGSNRKELNEPLGMELLAGVLNSDDIQVDMKWLLVEGIDYSEFQNYDLIGISAKLGTYEILKDILNYCQINLPLKQVVIGGPLATFSFDYLLKEFKNIICVRGEGETAFSLICKNVLSNNSKFESIPNLAYFKNGNLIETPRYTEKLDNQPFPIRKYLPIIAVQNGIARVESSRGCSWSRCDFCSVYEHYNSTDWRPFPIEYVIENLVGLSNSNILSPYFTDEDFFGGDYLRAEQLAKAVIEAKENGLIDKRMNFFVDLKASDILHPKSRNVLELWKKAGLREVFIGLESGCKNQLKRYGKSSTPDRNYKALALLKELDIQIDTGYILFDPEMTFDELIENADYINKIKLSLFDARSIKKMRAQPFTKLTEKYRNCSIITGDLDINSLCYPIYYSDNNVKIVMSLFEQWEQKYSEEVYNLQAKCRGEAGNEDLRRIYKDLLIQIRQLDFSILLLYIDYVKGNFDNCKLLINEHKIEIAKLSILNLSNNKKSA